MEIGFILSNIEKSPNPVIASEYFYWPEPLQNLARFKPLAIVEISEDNLYKILTQNAEFRDLYGLKIAAIIKSKNFNLNHLNKKNENLFPKIGPVSWKEFPLFFPIASEKLDMVLPIMLSNISFRMAAILKCFLNTKTSTHLYFFPYHDVSKCGELRVKIKNSKSLYANWINLPNSLDVNDKLKNNVTDFIKNMIDTCFINTALVDIYVERKADDYLIQLSEINPLHGADNNRLFNI